VRPIISKLAPTVVSIAVVFVSCLAAPGDARATLGGSLESVTSNEQRLGAVRRIQGLAAGERHDLELPSGTVVHEYVSSTGIVYGISWRGPRIPDLRELMGAYFAQLERRDARAAAGHHRLSVAGADLVVQSSGHQHAFVGRAWVPSLVPPGVDARVVVE
jgi:hypothetical protein